MAPPWRGCLFRSVVQLLGFAVLVITEHEASFYHGRIIMIMRNLFGLNNVMKDVELKKRL